MKFMNYTSVVTTICDIYYHYVMIIFKSVSHAKVCLYYKTNTYCMCELEDNNDVNIDNC